MKSKRAFLGGEWRRRRQEGGRGGILGCHLAPMFAYVHVILICSEPGARPPAEFSTDPKQLGPQQCSIRASLGYLQIGKGFHVKQKG